MQIYNYNLSIFSLIHKTSIPKLCQLPLDMPKATFTDSISWPPATPTAQHFHASSVQYSSSSSSSVPGLYIDS